MLNIPEAVKALFQTDGVRKNFRVHFPNSEYRDLTNSDIVAGSVKFTESVCSKEVLQFGLAEASRIEFECVGVPNIYGATIECFCEVDTSSLSSEYQTVKADVSYPVYAVPYGSFRVQSCPRNAGAMTHRRVEGYTATGEAEKPVSAVKMNVGTTRPVRYQNPLLLIADQLNSLEGLSVTEETMAGTDTNNWSSTLLVFQTWTVGEDVYKMYIDRGTVKGIHPTPSFNTVYRFTADVDTTFYESVKAKMIELGAGDDAVEQARSRCLPFIGGVEPVLAAASSNAFKALDNVEDSGYVYLYTDESVAPWLAYYTYVSMYITKNNNTRVWSAVDNGSVTNPVFKSYTLTDTNQQKLRMSFKGTSLNSSSSTPSYRYVDSIDMPSLLTGEAELRAQFVQSGRDGNLKKIALSKSSPITISKSEHSDFWFDEYSISPIGSIKYTYYDIDLKQEQTQIYSFGEGLSEYDMTDNYLLKHLAVSASDLTDQTVEEYVQSLFDTYFIPNISDISFIPVDLDMIGLPYTEAGDYIEVVAEDNTVVGTYVLSRSLSGEQYLTDAVESKGGEIIGSSVRSA